MLARGDGGCKQITSRSPHKYGAGCELDAVRPLEDLRTGFEFRLGERARPALLDTGSRRNDESGDGPSGLLALLEWWEWGKSGKRLGLVGRVGWGAGRVFGLLDEAAELDGAGYSCHSYVVGCLPHG